jgi:arylsulfatase A-like enzyme
LDRHFRRCAFLLALAGIVVIPHATCAGNRGKAEHVVVIVWDGMRPDFVSEKNTPALAKLAHEGVTFRNSHAVFPSATNVNGTALVTGAYPGHSGLLANHVYRPEIDANKSIDVEVPAVVRKGDELSGGKYISVPTIAELVQRGGGRSAIATGKTVGLLLDRHKDSAHGKDSVALFAGESLPPDSAASIAKILGPFPKAPKFSQGDSWTTKALTDFLWKDGVPAFSLLWLSEPDGSQHGTAPGAEAALTAIKSSDENLALALAALDRQHVRATTDVFVVSDHGFSTIRHMIELPKILTGAGFHVATEFTAPPQSGDIMLVGNGGAVLFYVTQHDNAVTHRLIEFLQRSDFAGVILTKGTIEGTFALDQGKIDNPTAPDVVLAFRWNDSKNQFGIPGMIDADWQRAAGKGTHATLSKFDMHNTLIAAGSDFRRGEIDDLPSGNVDLAPTIAHILGIVLPEKMDGRVLSEAMTAESNKLPPPNTHTLEATRKFPNGIWRQYLRVTELGGTIYLDEGNGDFVGR